MINHAPNQFVSYCSAFPDVWGCIQMCLDGSEHRNTPNLLDFWASANLGVYKLTGAILIGGVRWHQTFPRGGGPQVGWFELVLESNRLPVGPPTVNQWCQLWGLRVELVDLSWFSNPTSSLWVGPAGRLIWAISIPTGCLWDLLPSLSGVLFLVELCTSTGVVLCSKCELASLLEQCTRLGQAWVQWQLLRELPRSFLVVIETLWVLCNCLITHSFCVWAGCLCFSTVLLTVAKVKLAGVKW